MQAVILATDEAPRGGATKLHPLTTPCHGAYLPAALLPVLNRPVMAYALEALVRAGLRDIGIAVHNHGRCVEAHFGAGTGSGAQLTYLPQREPLGSAGSLRRAAAELRETFVVLPGDGLLDIDICAALAFHQAHRGIATVIVHEPGPGYPLDPVAVAPGGRVTALPPAPASGSTGSTLPLAPALDGQVLAATGAYIFEPRIFDWIPPGQLLDCYTDLLPQLLGSAGAGAGAVTGVHAYVAEGYWNPLHSVQAYHQAQLDALHSAAGGGRGGATGRAATAGGAESPDSGKGPSPRDQRRDAVGDAARAGSGPAGSVPYVSTQDRELAPGILAGRYVSVHPSAHLVPPVYIGAGSQIGRDVELGPGAVMGANTVVDEGAEIRNSCVLEGTYVGRLLKVEGRVVRGGLVVDAGSGESVRVVDRFLLGEVTPRLIVGPLARLAARAADCAGAALLLLLALPALAVIAGALLLTSAGAGRPGRVLERRPRVRWRRVGEGDVPERETYGVLHFRTRRADGRPAPLGALLERTALDRLPALASVLAGDLRLVGVKPLEPAEAGRLVEEWQRLPYETAATGGASAGFTGLWYVRSGGADLDEIAATDAYYTATRSFLEDVHVLLGTPAAWVRSWAGGGARPRQPGRRGQRGWATWRPRRDRRLFSARRLSPEAKAAKD